MNSIIKLAAFGKALVLAAVAVAAPAQADKLGEIRDRGKIVVGVKADYKPWGFLDPSGEVVGMEIDMAKDVADTLGVDLELVPVVASNRMQFLEEGKIDLMIATMWDNPKRRKVVGIVDPNYYASGVNILVKKSHGFTKWEDLRGKPVCGTQGAAYNKSTEQKYGARIVAFAGNAEIKQALQDGRCVAWVYDDSSIAAELSDPAWSAEYEMPLPSEDITPWGLAVPKDELEKPFGRFMAGMVYDWHRMGRLVELETKWGIQPTAFLKEMHDKFRN